MLDQLERVEKRYQELNRQIAMPEVASDLKQLQTLAQERASDANQAILRLACFLKDVGKPESEVVQELTP